MPPRDLRACDRCGAFRRARALARGACRDCAAGPAWRSPSDAWPAAGFRARLDAEPAAVVLYAASWRRVPAAVARRLMEGDATSRARFVVADVSDPADPRWASQRLADVPCLVYYEHGEELERLDPKERRLDADEVDGFLDLVEALQEPEVSARRSSRARSRRLRGAKAASRSPARA